jgi:hypothetical protein
MTITVFQVQEMIKGLNDEDMPIKQQISFLNSYKTDLEADIDTAGKEAITTELQLLNHILLKQK